MPSSEGGIQLFPSMVKAFPAKETFVLVPREVIAPGGTARRRRVRPTFTSRAEVRYVDVALTVTRSLVSLVGPPGSAASFSTVKVQPPWAAATRPAGQLKGCGPANSLFQLLLSLRIRVASAIPASAK